MPLWTGQPLAYPAVQKTGAAALNSFPDFFDLGMPGRFDVEMRRNCFDHPRQLRKFMLREEADMQVEVGPFSLRRSHPVLTDQDKGGEKYSLARRYRRQRGQ